MTNARLNAPPLKNAIVTGAAHRLGRAMACDLAARGYGVAIHHNASGDAANALAQDLRASGARAVALQADLLDEDATQDLIARAGQALGGALTLLVNNASTFDYDRIDTATRETWDRNIGTNLRAPFVLTQSFAAQAPPADVDAQGEPVATSLIVNIIDQRVRKLTPEFASYTIAKMGLWALTRTTAQALAPAVRVNAIGPGPTLRASRQSADHFTAQRAATLLGRGADPGDIVAALGYLLDAKAVTGQLICVDGGQHLNWQTPDVLGLE